MTAIKMPNVPKSAYHPDRSMNKIQRAQLAQFAEVFELPPLSAPTLQLTEEEAGKLIGIFTEVLVARKAVNP